jgi:UDP-4-amino-4-deoxy-L-arabinose formyltransferase/UDP-glucuronic acid dehydrogenase (UDP-4-keto-hexauronic acid decarboxylating)
MKSGIIFGDPRLLKSLVLTKGLLDISARRDDFKVLALCSAAESDATSRLRLVARSTSLRILQKIFNPSSHLFLPKEQFWTFSKLGKRYGVPVLMPPDQNINHPDFVAHLRRKYSADYAFSFGCPQLFKNDLLCSFPATINVHNGLLPSYRGWAATQWSIYNGESHTGFAFHFMTSEIDGGRILFEGRLPVQDWSSEELDYRKAKAAANRMEDVLDTVMRNSSGRKQCGSGHYYSRERTQRKISVLDPQTLTLSELRHRIRAFGQIQMKIGSRTYPVTRIDKTHRTAKHSSDCIFESADGFTLSVTRVAHLPWALARLF